MNRLSFLLVSVSLVLSPAVQASEPSKLNSVVKQKAKSLKKDTEDVKAAFNEDFDKSAKVISVEAEKIKNEITVLKEQIDEHAGSMNEYKDRIIDELKDKKSQLDDLIDSLDRI